MNGMRTLAPISLTFVLVFAATAQSFEPSNATTVVSQPLLEVRTAIKAYYDAQSKTNGVWSLPPSHFWDMTNSPA